MESYTKFGYIAPICFWVIGNKTRGQNDPPHQGEGLTINPRTGGGLSQLRTGGGGAGNRPPQRSRKRSDIETNGKRHLIWRDEIYKKYWDHFWIKPKLSPSGSKNPKFRENQTLLRKIPIISGTMIGTENRKKALDSQ